MAVAGSGARRVLVRKVLNFNNKSIPEQSIPQADWARKRILRHTTPH
jgi:hypothetical protein